MKAKKHLLFIVLAFFTLNACTVDEEDPGADPRDKYLGTWTVQESGKKKLTYEVEIAADPFNSVQVLISNFYNFGIQPYAIVTTSTLTVPTQSFASEGLTVWGSGSYANNKISWVYYVNDGANQDTIISTYTRK